MNETVAAADLVRRVQHEKDRQHTYVYESILERHNILHIAMKKSSYTPQIFLEDVNRCCVLCVCLCLCWVTLILRHAFLAPLRATWRLV